MLRKTVLVAAMAMASIAGAATSATAAVTDPGDDIGIDIVGGRNATQVYPFAVSLQRSGSHFCTGSLISSRWVVTARHCVGSGGFQMRIGSTNRTSGGTLVNALRIVRHPSSDIAVVQTDRAVTQAPVVIASATAVGQQTRIMGWGLTCPVRGCGSPPITLQELDTALVADSQCSGIRGSTEICVGNVDGFRGACFGDSGGPAVTPNGTGGWLLTGATSRSGGGARCGVSPAIYVDVPAHRSWIRTNTGV